MLWVLVLIVVTITVLGYFRSEYEKEALVVREYRMNTSKIRVPMTFVFLSDLHEHDFGNKNQRLIEEIETVNPDAVLIGGDLIVCKKEVFTSVSEGLCKALSEKFPVYYANGNHEERMRGDFEEVYRKKHGDVSGESGKESHGGELCKDRSKTHAGVFEKLQKKRRVEYERYIGYLKNIGVHYLSDAFADFEGVRIYGLNIDYKYYRKFRPPKMDAKYISSKFDVEYISSSLNEEDISSNLDEGEDDGKFRILLAHSPLFTKTYAKWGADLALSGHFHGGTIRLPFGIGLMTPQYQFFSNKVVGLKKCGNMSHIISAGLGTHSINIRINDKPELVVIRLIPD